MKDYTTEYQVNVPQGNLEEVAKLQKYADMLGYPHEGRQYGYNDMHGNTYVWSEDANYSIFISDFHGGEIEFCYSDYNDGEELLMTEAEIISAVAKQKNLLTEDFTGATTHEMIETYFNDWQMKKDLVAEYEAEEEMN